MSKHILIKEITDKDASTSSINLERLQAYLTGNDRSLVFFAGAGASLAGNTGMPSTASLLFHLLLQSLSSSGESDLQSNTLQAALKEITSHIGFEITLNDFWQICRQATTLLYRVFC